MALPIEIQFLKTESTAFRRQSQRTGSKFLNIPRTQSSKISAYCIMELARIHKYANILETRLKYHLLSKTHKKARLVMLNYGAVQKARSHITVLVPLTVAGLFPDSPGTQAPIRTSMCSHIDSFHFELNVAQIFLVSRCACKTFVRTKVY